MGFARTLVHNMVEGGEARGVFPASLEIIGASGSRPQSRGRQSGVVSAGYSHPLEMVLRGDSPFSVENNTQVMVSGSEQGKLVGAMEAAKDPRQIRPS